MVGEALTGAEAGGGVVSADERGGGGRGADKEGFDGDNMGSHGVAGPLGNLAASFSYEMVAGSGTRFFSLTLLPPPIPSVDGFFAADSIAYHSGRPGPPYLYWFQRQTASVIATAFRVNIQNSITSGGGHTDHRN